VLTTTTTTIPAGAKKELSTAVKLQVDNPDTFVGDENAKTGFTSFLATYLGVQPADIASVFSLLQSRLRRLQDGNVQADVTVTVPEGGDASDVKTKLEDMDSQDAALGQALDDAGATGYNPQVTEVGEVSEDVVTTAAPPPPTGGGDGDGDEGVAGGIIALIVILCVLLVGCVIFVIAYLFLRSKNQDNNANSNAAKVDANADNSGEIPEDAMDEHGAGVEVRARQFQVNLPQAEDNRETEEPEAIRS